MHGGGYLARIHWGYLWKRGFKPLKPIDLKEHERVEIIITSKSRWASEFKKLLDIVHERTKKFTSEEIEADITQAYREVQQK